MIFLSIISLLATNVHATDNDTFPAGFKIGIGSSAYQIEGGWNVSDKGENVWDHFTHENPSPIFDKSNGDVSCDSYHRYKEDIAILKDLGVDFYRFSLSWSRILPNGFANKISKDGLRYYKNLLDDLRALGIEPMVSIYHWDHPHNLEEMGGWTNELMVTWFTDYARIVFRELGGRVKIFSTINEPAAVCNFAYGTGAYAPGKKYPGIGPYLCMHNMLKAHAKAYKIYDSEYRSSQNGQVGITIPCTCPYPKYTNDTESSEIQFAFACGWTANPIFSITGDYPAVMKQRIAENSKIEGYPKSRLPEFTKTEIDEIRGSSDYFGLNHYTSVLTESVPKSNDGTWYKDSGVMTSYNDSWPSTASSWLKIVPQGLGDIVRMLKNHYNNPTIYVLENGISDGGSIDNDSQRIRYFHDYLRELLISINRDGCNVRGYSAWSLFDNFEWERGYSEHFGLVNVDFQTPTRLRTPKLSFSWFRELVKSRRLPPVDGLQTVI